MNRRWSKGLAGGVCCGAWLIFTQVASGQMFIGLSTEIQPQPIQQECQDGPCPAIDCTAELGVDICHLYAEFDAQFPDVRMLFVSSSDIAATAPFFQNPFSTDYPPSCPFIPVFPDMQCDTFVTFNRLNNCFGDATRIDPDFFVGPDFIVGGWTYLDSTSDQGHPQPGPDPDIYRVLIAQFALPVGGTVSGAFDVGWRAPEDGPLQITPAAFDSAPCDGDVNADGFVDGIDLGLMLGTWGQCSGCATDLNDDGEVDASDLALFLGNWGPCL